MRPHLSAGLSVMPHGNLARRGRPLSAPDGLPGNEPLEGPQTASIRPRGYPRVAVANTAWAAASRAMGTR